MKSNMNLPKEYTPYHSLDICSNIATNYQIPIGANNFAPLLVGKGEEPLIWVAISNPKNTEEWKYLVSMNKSLHPNIKVEVDKEKCSVCIKAGNDTLLLVTSKNKDSARIELLDLRAIGLNIVGDSKALRIGGNTMSGNMFSNVGTVIGLG